MNIWFTSDYHFSHKNISGSKVSSWISGFRTFDDHHQMNKTIIETTNKYVKTDDLIYFLGDFCFGDHNKTPIYRNLITEKSMFIPIDSINFLANQFHKI